MCKFSLKFAMIRPDLAKSHQIRSRSHRIDRDLAKSSQIWPDFVYNSSRVQVAHVLEKETRHSTHRCQFLKTESRCRLTGPSV